MPGAEILSQAMDDVRALRVQPGAYTSKEGGRSVGPAKVTRGRARVPPQLVVVAPSPPLVVAERLYDREREQLRSGKRLSSRGARG